MVVSAVVALMVPVMEMALETAAIAALVAVTSRKARTQRRNFHQLQRGSTGCDKLINLSGADGSGKQTESSHSAGN